MGKNPLKPSKEDIAAFRQRLIDRSWAIVCIDSDAPLDKETTEGQVGALFKAARSFEGLADHLCPCFIVGDGGPYVRGIFLENPNHSAVAKFCVVTSAHLFVTSEGYTDSNGKVLPSDPLDYDWLEVGEIASPLFEKGYFVVATKYKEVKQEDDNVVAVMAEQLVAFKVPSSSAQE